MTDIRRINNHLVSPTTITPDADDNSTNIPNTAWVWGAVNNTLPLVLSDTISGAGSPNYLDGAAKVDAFGNVLCSLNRTDKSLSLFDISDPENMTLLGTIVDTTRLNNAWSMKINAGYAFVVSQSTDTNTYIVAYDISTPATPTFASQLLLFTAGQSYGDLELDGNDAYISSQADFSLFSVDISNPSVSMTQLDRLYVGTTQNFLFIDVFGDVLYATMDGEERVATVDISNPSSLSIIDQLDILPNKEPYGIAFGDGIAYVLSNLASPTGLTLYLYDVSDTSNISAITSYNISTDTAFAEISGLQVINQIVLLTNERYDSLYVIDCRNVDNITTLQTLTGSNVGSPDGYADIVLHEGYLYVANDFTNSLQSFRYITPNHDQNTDTYLAIGTNDQVSAPEAKAGYDHSLVVTGNPHNVLATQISDFDTEVSDNTDVASNTAHVEIVAGNPHGTVASQIAVTPIGSVMSTDLQGAIDELASNIVNTTIDVNPASFNTTYVVDTTSGNVTITLPNSAVTNDAKLVRIVKSVDANVVNITTVGGTQNIGTLTTQTITAANTGVTLISNFSNTKYEIIQDSRSVSASRVFLSTLNGATYTSLQQMQDVYHSTGLASGGDISDAGLGNITVDGGSGYIRATDDPLSTLFAIDFNAITNQAIPDNDTTYVYVDYNAGSPIIATSTTVAPNYNQYIVLGSVYREGTTLHINNTNAFQVGDHAGLMIQRLQETFPFARVSGGVISETGTRNIAITAGRWWEGLNTFTTTAADTSVADTFSYHYQDGFGGWTTLTLQTQINNLNYDNGTGTLGVLSNNKYGVHWVYLGVDSDLYVVFGTGDYSTVAEAEAAPKPASLPEVLQTHARLVGRIIIQKSAATFTEINSTFDTTLETASISDHNQLTSLQGGTVGEYVHLTLTQHADLIDGGDSTLHYHASDRNRANHTGTQTASTISDFDARVSSNTDVADNTTHRGITGSNPHLVPHNNTTNLNTGDYQHLTVAEKTNFYTMETIGLQNLTAAEVTQLRNIDTTTISTTQWGYVGGLNQALTNTSDVTFNDITVSADFMSGTGGATLLADASTGKTYLNMSADRDYSAGVAGEEGTLSVGIDHQPTTSRNSGYANIFVKRFLNGGTAYSSGDIISGIGFSSASVAGTGEDDNERGAFLVKKTGSNDRQIGFSFYTTTTASSTIMSEKVSIDHLGNLTLLEGDLIISSPTVPLTATSPGVAGQLAYDSDNFYVCIATNSWKRAALSAL